MDRKTIVAILSCAGALITAFASLYVLFLQFEEVETLRLELKRLKK